MKRVARKNGKWPIRTWRPNDQDCQLIDELIAKLHLSESNVLRLALARLAEFEGIDTRENRPPKREAAQSLGA
jgi:hypothetical protein